MEMPNEEESYLALISRVFIGSSTVGAFAVWYATESLAVGVVYVSSAIALAALFNGLSSRIYALIRLVETSILLSAPIIKRNDGIKDETNCMWDSRHPHARTLNRLARS